MKALAVQQPWASLLCLGIKNVENRSWETSHRGKLLIVASSKKVVSNFMDCMPVEIYDTIINEQIFGNVPEDLNQLPTSAVIGYVTIKDCVKGEYLSEWGGPEFQWVVEEAYLFDEPQLVGIKAKLKLFDVPEIDENNLPPAHKVKLKGMRLDGDTLNISITDKCLDEVLENGELRLGFYATNVCYELEDENGLREFKHVAFKSPTRNITMEKKDFKALCYMEDEEVKQVPSVLYGDQVDWNFYSIEVGNVEENSQAKETTQEGEPGTTVKGEIIMVPEERFYVLKCALLNGELNCDVKVGDPVTVTFDDGRTLDSEIVRIEIYQKLIDEANAGDYVGIHIPGVNRNELKGLIDVRKR